MLGFGLTTIPLGFNERRNMGIAIFIIVVLVIVSATIYISLKSKTHCPNCNSKNIVMTGKKIYKETPPIALYGSPGSYHEFEFKCSKCGHLFWERKKALIFN